MEDSALDDFVHSGSEQARTLMNYLGMSHSYETTCVGYNTGAYYQAGLMFWGGVVLVIFAILILLRKSIAYAFA